MGITHSARYAMCGKPSRLAGMRSINGQQVAKDRSCIWISWMFIKAIIIITIARRQCMHICVCVCVSVEIFVGLSLNFHIEIYMFHRIRDQTNLLFGQ